MTQRGRSRFLWNIRLSENRASHDTMFYLHFTHKNRYPAFSDTHILERRLHFFPRWKCWGNDHKEVGKMLGQAMREAWRWKLKAKLWRSFWICLYEKIRYSGGDLSSFMIRYIYIYIHTYIHVMYILCFFVAYIAEILPKRPHKPIWWPPLSGRLLIMGMG